MSIQTRPFGHMPNGEPVTEYILTNQNGLTATFLDLGGIWRQMLVPDREGRMEDVVLGYDTVSQIQIGVVGGYVGSMEYLIRRTKAEMAEPDREIKVIATGGLARLVADHTDEIDVVDSELILEGLVRIYRNYKKEHP